MRFKLVFRFVVWLISLLHSLLFVIGLSKVIQVVCNGFPDALLTRMIFVYRFVLTDRRHSSLAS